MNQNIKDNLEILEAVGDCFVASTQLAKIANGKETRPEITNIINGAISELIGLAKKDLSIYMNDGETREFDDLDTEYIDNDDNEKNDLEEEK